MSAHRPNSSKFDPWSPVATGSEGPARLAVHSVGTPDVGRPLMSHFHSLWKTFLLPMRKQLASKRFDKMAE